MDNIYFKIREKRDILKSKKGNIKIYTVLSNLLDKTLDKKYKYKIIKLPTNYDIKKQIEGNPQFELVNDLEVKCATRNNIYLSDYDEYINRKSIKFKKHKIVKILINNPKIRDTSFFCINYAAFMLSHIIEGYFEQAFLASSLFATLPFYCYLKIEESHLVDEIKNVEKYDIVNSMEDIYQELINNFCLLIYELKITDPLDILLIYSETISKICIPEIKLCSYDYEKTTNLIEKTIGKCLDSYSFRMIGYNILMGFSVCRNHAKIFKDICIRLGYDVNILCVKAISKENTYHAIDLIKYNNSTYLLDPYRVNNYKMDDKLLICEELNQKYSTKIDIKTKKTFLRMGVHTCNKKYDNIKYTPEVSILKESLLNDNIMLKINEFNDTNKKLIGKFKCLFYDIAILENKEKVKLKDMVIK